MLQASGREKNKPADFHLPVGGRRFRPCLEDIIEFCILERLVTPRVMIGSSALNTSRDKYHDRQFNAAVRRNLAAAAEVLERHNWQVTEPADLNRSQ